MSENKIKNALDSVEPTDDAKERMYNNIMKKAQRQKDEILKAEEVEKAKKAEEVVQKPKAVLRIVRYALPIAACFCLLALGITRFFPAKAPAEPNESNVLGGNPFVEVQSADDFKPLAITLDAPDKAVNVSYAIIDGKIAEIQFELNGKSYLARASAQEGDFSGLNGREISQETIDAKNNAVLTAVQTDTDTFYKIVWTNGKIKYCLFATDGASKQQTTAVYEAIKK